MVGALVLLTISESSMEMVMPIVVGMCIGLAAALLVYFGHERMMSVCRRKLWQIWKGLRKG